MKKCFFSGCELTLIQKRKIVEIHVSRESDCKIYVKFDQLEVISFLFSR